MIVARVVLPRPGGPYRRTWSAASPLPRAAWSSTDRFALTSRWPMYSSSVRGRRVPSMTRSPSSSRSAERMRERSSAIGRESSTPATHFARMFDVARSPTTATRHSGLGCRACASPAAPNTACAPSIDLVRHEGEGPIALATPGRAQPAAGQVPRADHGHAQARAASSGRRSARTAATRSRPTRRPSRSAGSSGCSTARSRRSAACRCATTSRARASTRRPARCAT